MILLVDNYDSFTYNLYQYLRELGVEVLVRRNDAVSAAEARGMGLRAVVISPGPGRPSNAGVSGELIATLGAEDRVPILGVCLGHQAIGEAFGARVVSAQRLMHGKTSLIRHDGRTIFANLPNPLRVMRYHSLALEGVSESVFEISARNEDDNEVMAMRHRELPLEGVQFHPESVMTEMGRETLKNFLDYYLEN